MTTPDPSLAAIRARAARRRALLAQHTDVCRVAIASEDAVEKQQALGKAAELRAEVFDLERQQSGDVDTLLALLDEARATVREWEEFAPLLQRFGIYMATGYGDAPASLEDMHD